MIQVPWSSVPKTKRIVSGKRLIHPQNFTEIGIFISVICWQTCLCLSNMTIEILLLGSCLRTLISIAVFSCSQLQFVNFFYSFNEWMNEWMNSPLVGLCSADRMGVELLKTLSIQAYVVDCRRWHCDHVQTATTTTTTAVVSCRYALLICDHQSLVRLVSMPVSTSCRCSHKGLLY